MREIDKCRGWGGGRWWVEGSEGERMANKYHICDIIHLRTLHKKDILCKFKKIIIIYNNILDI